MFHFGFFGNDLSNIMGVQKPWTSCFIWLVSLRGLNSDSGRRGFSTLHNRLLGWHCTHCAHKHGCHIPKRWRCLQKSCASASFRTIDTVFWNSLSFWIRRVSCRSISSKIFGLIFKYYFTHQSIVLLVPQPFVFTSQPGTGQPSFTYFSSLPRI